ncbi:hypothetical protein [Gottfriedia acidiceleris]|uniref:hypothetical protein n=1 Tax=Gottfriedia acidiceleris TaxID=371036 RepID=UPI003D1B1935
MKLKDPLVNSCENIPSMKSDNVWLAAVAVSVTEVAVTALKLGMGCTMFYILCAEAF